VYVCPGCQLVSVRRARAGYLAPDGLCRTCAACRWPQPWRAGPTIRLVAPEQESEIAERLGSARNNAVPLAVVMLGRWVAN